MSLKGKIALITGGNAGIGAATAILFAKEGANVAIVGRNQERLRQVADQIEMMGCEALILQADLSKENDVKNIIKNVIDTYGALDILVNNAGMLKLETITGDKILEVYDETMNVNLRSVVHITSLAIPHLIKTKGNIVNVSSVVGKIPVVPSFLSYSLSKAGVDHLTRCLALELASFGIRVNSVSPGAVNNEFLKPGSHYNAEDFKSFTALNRLSESEDIAEIILFLASDKAKGITGTDILSDNGHTLKRCN